MVVELCKMFVSDTDMAIINMSIPPLKWVGCSILSSVFNIFHNYSVVLL